MSKYVRHCKLQSTWQVEKQTWSSETTQVQEKHLLDASIAISALSLGTVSPKKTTFIIINNENIKDISVMRHNQNNHTFSDTWLTKHVFSVHRTINFFSKMHLCSVPSAESWNILNNTDLNLFNSVDKITSNHHIRVENTSSLSHKIELQEIIHN